MQRISFQAEIKPYVLEGIAKYAKEAGWTEGQVIEFLWNFHEHTAEAKPQKQ